MSHYDARERFAHGQDHGGRKENRSAASDFVSQMAAVGREAARAAGDAVRWFVGDGVDTPPNAQPHVLRLPLEGAMAVVLNLERGEIEVTAAERADAVLYLLRGEPADLEVTAGSDTLRICQRRAHDRSGHGWFDHLLRRVDIALIVPASLGRLEARTGLGSVYVRDLPLRAVLATGKGDVHMTAGSFEGDVSTALGNIKLAGVHGTSTIHTGCGNITIRILAGGRLKVSTGAGNIDLQRGSLAGLHASSGAGDIRATLRLYEGEFRLESGAGNVSVELPADQAVQIEAVTGMGKIQSDWPLVQVGRPGPASHGSARMVGSSGNQERRPRLMLRSGLGDVVLRRGEAAAPAAETAAATPGDTATTASVSETAGKAHLAILESLSRGEITVEEAEEMIVRLGAA